MIIKLSSGEVYQAAQVGIARWLESEKSERGGQLGKLRENSVTTDVIGAIGECAFAKSQNVYWSKTINTFKLPDVGEFQVRATLLDNGKLIIRPTDSMTEIYVLVTVGDIFRPHIRGAFYSGDVTEDMLQAPGGRPPAYFVPQSKLKPVSDLNVP